MSMMVKAEGGRRKAEMFERAVLLKAETVAHLLDRQPYEIIERATEGTIFHRGFQWVFDVSAKAESEKAESGNKWQRDLRFWTKEILMPEFTLNLSIEEVVNSILPITRSNYPAGEVEKLLRISPMTLKRLREQLSGSLRSSGAFFPRAGLADFLCTRWIHRVVLPTLNTQHSTLNPQQKAVA
jgi:hypothetical protein